MRLFARNPDGVEGTIAIIVEADRILDLAFVAAVWRYTQVIGKERYRAGIDSWPPREDWCRDVIAPRAIAAPVQGAAASSSSSQCNGGAEPSTAAASAT